MLRLWVRTWISEKVGGGQPWQAAEWFTELFGCKPPRETISDWLIDLVSIGFEKPLVCKVRLYTI